MRRGRFLAAGALAAACLCAGRSRGQEASIPMASIPSASIPTSIPTASISTRDTLVTQFTYTATVPGVTTGAKHLAVWLPLPSDSPQQTIRELTIDSPVPYRITREARWGNRMVYLHTDTATRPFAVTVRFVVARKVEVGAQGQAAQGAKTGGASVSRTSDAAESYAKSYTESHTQGSDRQTDDAQAGQRRLLRPDAKVPVGGRWKTLALDNTWGQANARAKMRGLFEHVVATMQYDYKKESPHLGEGDVAFVCDYKKGNCSDLHSYLISLARSLSIPAVLEYGFPIAGVPVADPLPPDGTIGGYHCWMWFYDDTPADSLTSAPGGWTPLDAADARRWLDAGRPERKERLFGHLIAERSAVTMSRGRDLTLAPPQKGRPLNYFIYPYAEADGNPVEARWTLRYHRL